MEPRLSQKRSVLWALLLLLAGASGGGCHLIYTYEDRDSGASNGESGAPGDSGSDACLPISAGTVVGDYTGT